MQVIQIKIGDFGDSFLSAREHSHAPSKNKQTKSFTLCGVISITYLETFWLYWHFDSSEVKMVLHNSILKFDFAYKMIILRQYSKKNYRKIPKSSKFCIKSQILNCLEFNNYWILLDKIKICCRISIPESLFPLLVFVPPGPIYCGRVGYHRELTSTMVQCYYPWMKHKGAKLWYTWV